MAELFRLDIEDPVELGKYVILHEMIPFELRNNDLCIEKIKRTIEFFKRNKESIVAIGVIGKLGLIGIHWGLYKSADEFHIMGLFVKKGWRRFGYGGLLKVSLEDRLEPGTRVSSQVHITNLEMQKLSRRSGYIPAKVKDNQTIYLKVI